MLSNHFRNAIVSSNTLRGQDLVQSFMAFLEDELSDKAPFRTKIEYQTIRSNDYVKRACEGEWTEPFSEMDERTHEVLNNALDLIFVIMNSIAPEGCYFGSSEGDGACFGFWECEDEEY